MFGLTMHVRWKRFGVTLRPLTKADLVTIVEHINSMKIHMFTQGLFAQTLESEEEWYERNRKDQTTYLWAIVPEGSSVIVGITSLHNIDNVHGTCVSGIIIWDSSWWGKGVATRAHLARTLFAADYLQRLTIKSATRDPNIGSSRALLRVGYNLIGVEPRTSFRAGQFLDTKLFCWINPRRVKVLFPEGLPEEYKEGVLMAKKALALARKVVSFP